MADKYTAETWQDRAGVGLGKYEITGTPADGATIVLTANPDSITQAGTSITAAVMNNIEGGVEKALNSSRNSDTTTTDEVTHLASTVYDGELKSLVKGRSLVNFFENGNVTTSITSDGSGTGIGLETDGTWYFDSGFDNSKQTVNVVSGDKLFVYFKADSSSVGAFRNLVRLRYSGSSDTFGDNDDATLLEYYDLITVTTTGQANLLIAEGDSGLITRDHQIAINLTAMGNDTEGTAYADYTEAQLLELVRAGYFEGIGSVEQTRVTSVNKNLVDIYGTKVTRSGNSGDCISEDGGFKVSVATNFGVVGIAVRLKPSTTYILSCATRDSHLSLWAGRHTSFPTDSHGANRTNYDSAAATTLSFTTTANETWGVIGVYLASGVTLGEAVTNLQLEEGSSATTYVKHFKTSGRTHGTLRSVPNGTYDEEDLNTGERVTRIASRTLVSGDIDSVVSGSNNQRAVIGLDALPNIKTQTALTDDGGTIVSGFTSETTETDIAGDDNHWYTNTSNLYVMAPLGTWADLAAARTALTSTVTTKVVYELDPDSYVTEYYPSNSITAWADGTIINEPSVQEVLTYDSDLTITDTDLPINSLDYVYKLDTSNNKWTPIDLSTATYSAGDTSFTLSAASNGELYRFAYFPLFGTTRASLTYSTSNSVKEQIDNNSEMIGRVDEKVNRLQDEVDNNVGTWELISEYLVEDSADSQIDFENISTKYSELKMFISGVASTTTSQQLHMQFNSDTAGNYDYAIYSQTGSSVNTSVGGSATNINIGDDLLENSSTTGLQFAVVTINNSNASHYKHVLVEQAEPTASINMRKHGAGLWRNTSSKITSITFTAETDSIGVDSKFVLLGRRFTG